jgi:hypothetical protein
MTTVVAVFAAFFAGMMVMSWCAAAGDADRRAENKRR